MLPCGSKEWGWRVSCLLPTAYCQLPTFFTWIESFVPFSLTVAVPSLSRVKYIHMKMLLVTLFSTVYNNIHYNTRYQRDYHAIKPNKW